MTKLTLPMRFGVAISGSLIGYFLLLALFNYHTNPFFSLFNGVIAGFGIYEAIKYHKLEEGNKFTYTSGFTVGISAGFVSTIIFTIFFLIYATEVNPEFIEDLLTVFKREYNVSIGLVCFVVAIMGFATSVVLTLTFMQIFKNSNNPYSK